MDTNKKRIVRTMEDLILLRRDNLKKEFQGIICLWDKTMFELLEVCSEIDSRVEYHLSIKCDDGVDFNKSIRELVGEMMAIADKLNDNERSRFLDYYNTHEEFRTTSTKFVRLTTMN